MSRMTDKQIKEAINDEWKAIEQWNKLHDEKTKFHMKNIDKLRKECPHTNETYTCVPYDSSYICDVCGNER